MRDPFTLCLSQPRLNAPLSYSRRPLVSSLSSAALPKCYWLHLTIPSAHPEAKPGPGPPGLTIPSCVLEQAVRRGRVPGRAISCSCALHLQRLSVLGSSGAVRAPSASHVPEQASPRRSVLWCLYFPKLLHTSGCVQSMLSIFNPSAKQRVKAYLQITSPRGCDKQALAVSLSSLYALEDAEGKVRPPEQILSPSSAAFASINLPSGTKAGAPSYHARHCAPHKKHHAAMQAAVSTSRCNNSRRQ